MSQYNGFTKEKRNVNNAARSSRAFPTTPLALNEAPLTSGQVAANVVAALQAASTAEITAGRRVLRQTGTVASQRFVRVDG